MNRRWRAVAGLSIVGIISTGIIILLSIHLLQKSHTKTVGSFKLPGLRSETKISRDSYGVPHIIAKNEDDMYYALGFASAQDRLWQMDMLRRTANGTLSEIFGAKTLDSDRLFRTFGIARLTTQLGANISGDSQRILLDYTNGINAFLRQYHERLPIEYALLKTEPAPWTVQDCLAIQRLYAWYAMSGHLHELLISAIRDKVGPQKTKKLFPNVIPGTTPIISAQTSLSLIEALNPDNQPCPLNNLGGVGWICSGHKTQSGKPILVCNLNAPFTTPTLFYEVQIAAPFQNAYGWFIPGFPGLICGKTPSACWSMIPASADGIDIFVHRTKEHDASQYLLAGTWKSFIESEDIIQVRDSEPDTLHLCLSEHGPVISKLIGISKAISLQWTGFIQSDDLSGYSQLLKASDISDIRHALSQLSVPSMQALYADTSGSYNSSLLGTLPNRNQIIGQFPRQGWTVARNWQATSNTLRDGSAAAVTDVVTYTQDSPNKISDDLSATDVRLLALLNDLDFISIKDIKTIQQDQTSQLALNLMPKIKSVANEITSETDDLQNYFLDALAIWDYRIAAESVPASIFQVLTKHLLHNLIYDELGDTLGSIITQRPGFAIHLINRITADPGNPWIDNTTTSAKESLNDILLLSLNETYRYLRTHYGDLIHDWRWGKLHSFSFTHSLATTSLLAYPMNIGPFQPGGDNSTILQTGFVFADTLAAKFGPVLRWYVDTAHMDTVYSIIATGQSGQPLSLHYNDQSPLWLSGDYRRSLHSPYGSLLPHYDLLTLKPE